MAPVRGAAMVLTVVSALALSSCGEDGGSSAASSNDINIFGLNAMTGQSAPYGVRVQQGAELAIDELNAAGGVTDDCGDEHELTLSRNDIGDDPKQAITLTRKAAQDKNVTAILGPAPSTAFVPMVPLAKSLKIPMVATGSGAAIEEWNEYAFRVNAVSGVADALMLEGLADMFEMERVAVIYQSDNQGQSAGAQAVSDEASKLGYEVVASETFQANQSDFSAQLTKIKSADPDFVGIYGEGPQAAPITAQAREMGMDATLFYGIGAIPLDPVNWDLSQGAMEGAITWTDALVGASASGGGAKFTEDYKAKFSEDPTAWSVYGYYAVGAIAEAVKKACSTTDREKIAEALGSVSYTAPDGGTVEFSNPPTGENQNPPIYITKTTGRGEFEVLVSPTN